MESILADLLGHYSCLHDQVRRTDQEFIELTGKITRLKEGNR